MGCLNSGQGFHHWFANIHLSGPCNRSCYFCVGQWMPGQDKNNNLGDEPMRGYDEFLAECRRRAITEVNITGTNTDPLMKKDLDALLARLRADGFTNIGLRTNGVLHQKFIRIVQSGLIDKASISITSFNPSIYLNTMGSGHPPPVRAIAEAAREAGVPIKLNVVLCPETVCDDAVDVLNTIRYAQDSGIPKVNLREPYGQTHIGDPMAMNHFIQTGEVYGNPIYGVGSGNHNCVEVTYWDVHYTEVESVNLYADGHVSVEYPVTLGHSETLGVVRDQSHFVQGRQRAQWQGTKRGKTA